MERLPPFRRAEFVRPCVDAQPEAGGWKTASMMARYAHLDPTTIRAAVELLTARPKLFAQANGHQNGHQRPDVTENSESKAATSA